MKFKGTKGKWELFKSESYCEIQTQKPLISICAVNPNVEEHLYNAQLISKAPEMLEMLKDIKDYLGSDKRQQVEQLIEEATKID